MIPPRITYDDLGTPGVWAGNVAQAYWGLGFLHGLHRPLQTLVIASAGRGDLARRLLPRHDVLAIDALAARFDVSRRAAQAVTQLSSRALEWLDAYVAGVAAGLARGGKPFEQRLLFARLPSPCRASVLGASILASYLGLAEGQERMERALIDAVAAGADTAVLETMFSPHLQGWDPAPLRHLKRCRPLGFASHGLVGAVGGSNAWAVTGARSASGRPLFAGDPHLQLNQMPALFFELRVKLGHDYWLGATIPGLPGLVVGRNRTLAWSGTFGVADNVDFTIEEISPAGARRGEAQHVAVTTREALVRRRCQRPLHLRFHETDRGVLETDETVADGTTLAARWAGCDQPAAALEAYMALPLATSVGEAEATLRDATAFSLHYVLADRSGDVLYCQAGRIPRRSHGWSGLFPVRGDDARQWTGFYEGVGLPRAPANDGLTASANEARVAADGATLSTLAQPDYRLRRIETVLRSRTNHDLASMKQLQLDLVSLQADRMRPLFLAALPGGPLHNAMATWDLRYDAASRGARSFEIAYEAVRASLAFELGGEWFTHMLAHSELDLWWCAALDRVIIDPASWQGPRAERMRAALSSIAAREPEPLGIAQRFVMPHLILGGIPGSGFDRGPYALRGSRATVCQGTIARPGDHPIVIAPAYRFVCDLGEDAAETSLPGGIDGSRFSDSYDRWLTDYLDGTYHRLEPPRDDEAELVLSRSKS